MRNKKATSYKIGLIAELIAIFLLTVKFYKIIERRHKTKIGEIDIIAVQGKTLVFIEVKSRRNKSELFEAITNNQKNRIIKAAELYISKKPQYNNYKKRFDAIFITPNLLPVHIKNAWERNS